MITKPLMTLGDDSISDPSSAGNWVAGKGRSTPCSSCAHNHQGETSHCRWVVTELHDVRGGRQCPETVETPRRVCLMGWAVREGFGEEVTGEVGLEW